MSERQRPCCGGARRESRGERQVRKPRAAASASEASRVRVVYLGGRNVQFLGESGVSYHFGPHRRRGAVSARDLAIALARADFMLDPDAQK